MIVIYYITGYYFNSIGKSGLKYLGKLLIGLQ